MALTNMKKAHIIGHNSSRDEVIETLQRLGLLQLTQLEEEDLLPHQIPLEIRDTVENRLVDLGRAIQFLTRYDNVKKSLIQQFAGSKVLVEESTFLGYLSQGERALQLMEECHQLEKRLGQIDSHLNKLLDHQRDLLPWREMDIPLEELPSTNTIGIFCGLLDRKAMDLYQEEQKRELKASCLLELGEEGEKEIPFILFYYPEDKELLQQLNNRYQLSLHQFPMEQGTIQGNLKELEEEKKQFKREKEGILVRVQQLQREKELLQAHYDATLLEKQQYSIVNTTGSTEQLFVVEGWVKEDDETTLQHHLHQVSSDLVYESRPPLQEEDPPIALKNPPAIQPFEVVTQLYGTPNKTDIDPTKIMAPFFFLFFGLCLTDAGYGIILSLLSLLALKKIPMAGMAKKLFQLLFLGGIATFILGVLTGGWFGDLIPIKEIWFNPNDDPLFFLIVSLILGVIHVYVGILVTLYKNMKNNQVQEALLNQGVWLLFITGLLSKFVGPLLVESTFLYYLGQLGTFLGGGILILTQGRHQKAIIARLGSGILSLYDLVGYLSDVLSYSRLLALGLATSVIAMVINDIAKMVNTIPILGFIFMVLIMIIGHLFNLVINLISSYVHTSRLQYVEFFSKFLVAGGKPFAPFGVSTEYLDLHFSQQGPLLKR